MTDMPSELGLGDVYRACDTTEFDFKNASELPDLTEIIGQDRAVSSVQFGMGVTNDGYNIFAVGPTGTGKSSTIYDFLQKEAASMPAPDDWVYVQNFETPYKPHAIRMAPGRGQEFRKYMEKLVEDLKAAITQAFETEDYEKQKQNLIQDFGERQKGRYDQLSQTAESRGFTIMRSPAGLAFVPKQPSGEPMSQEMYQSLPGPQRNQIDEGMKNLNEELQQMMRLARREERDGREALRELDRQVTTFAAKHLIDEACEIWCDSPGVSEFFKAVLEDVVDNVDDFKKSEEEAPPGFMGMPMQRNPEMAFRKYKINVVVDNSALKGAPVVTETNPIVQNLVGRVEHLAQFGALLTDFNMIKAGALHRANGGYLVLDARDVLTKPYAWDALKRTLKTCEIRVEDVYQQMGFAATASLDPQPIPFKAKIVLIGEPMVYYLLFAQDPDFRELFKIKADFDTVVERTPENEKLYAQFIGRISRDRGLLPFAPDGAARVIEHCSRLIEDQRRMTTRFRDVADLIVESSYWAQQNHKGEAEPMVGRADVQKAIDQWIYRSNRVEERAREMITDRTKLVDTSGAVVGQVNGLAVSSSGDYMFGQPSRITATHRLGDGKVIDIEREVEMGGPIHSKGVMILAGYLGWKFASDRPMSLNARLVFEQSYGGVEGDSASSTELYALLSSLSGIPIQQRFAVTGSVNQLGQVQAIGGVNEKIEGYFGVCEALGLKGDEGVLIPKSNVPHLMLNEKVQKAISEGKFHIYPIAAIDEGISVLTGVPAGECDEQGVYPEGTINRAVVDRLTFLAEKSRELAEKKREEEGERKHKKEEPTPAPTPPAPKG